MPNFGSSAVVVSDGQVLLIKRRDVEVWALPGGAINSGESTAQAAIREVKEETGIDIDLIRLIGIYSSPNWHSGGDHAIVYAAIPKNGKPVPQVNEVLDVGYFSPDRLPEPFTWWHRRRIDDALRGVTGVSCVQDRVWTLDPNLSRREIYDMLTRSGLSPSDFYEQYFTEIGQINERIEVDGVSVG